MIFLKRYRPSNKLLIASNTTAQMLGRVVSVTSMFIITLIIARSFGSHGYGEFTKIITFVSFFYLASDFGANAIFIQETNDKKQKSDNYWSNLLAFRICLSVFFTILAMIILVFLPQGQENGYNTIARLGIILFLPTIFFQSAITSANAVFQKHLRYKFSFFSILAGSLLSVIFVLLSSKILFPAGLYFTIIALGISVLANALFSLGFIHKYLIKVRLDFNFRKLLSLLSKSLPLAIVLVFNMIYFRADSVILTLTRSTSEVGVYGLAHKIFEFPLVIPTFFMNTIYPLMIKETQKRNFRISESLNKLTRKAGIILVGLSIVFMIFINISMPFLNLIRAEFLESAAPLRILSLGLPFFFLSSLTMWYLISLKKHTLLAVIYGLSMLVNILLNIIFIPTYGVIGASIIAVFSESLILIFSAISIKYLINVKNN